MVNNEMENVFLQGNAAEIQAVRHKKNRIENNTRTICFWVNPSVDRNPKLAQKRLLRLPLLFTTTKTNSN